MSSNDSTDGLTVSGFFSQPEYQPTTESEAELDELWSAATSSAGSVAGDCPPPLEASVATHGADESGSQESGQPLGSDTAATPQGRKRAGARLPGPPRKRTKRVSAADYEELKTENTRLKRQVMTLETHVDMLIRHIQVLTCDGPLWEPGAPCRLR